MIDVSVKGGDLLVEFSNGASVILKGYQGASDVTLQLADGHAVSANELLSYYTAQAPSENQLQAPANENTAAEEQNTAQADENPAQNGIEKLTELDNPLQVIQQQIAEDQGQKTASADDIAARLAQVEPAAGNNGPQGGSPQNTGLGFGSSFQSQGVISLSDVGPINPTALQYGLPEFADRVLTPQGARLSPLHPLVEAQDTLVYEDGSETLKIHAVPQNENGQLTITLSGFRRLGS
ncbi:MAG: hypothetical protein LRY39_00275 [Alphaproteobacteria bacterium]|nr:hypothetical protein [Alphaproteobacteria bacterium]